MAWQSCWEIKPMKIKYKWNRLKCELFVVDAKTLSLTLALCRIHLSMDFIMIDFFRILFDFYWYDPFSFNDLSINVPILFFYIIASHCGRRCHHFCAGPNGKKPSHEMTWCWHLWKYKEFILSFWANHIATGRKAAAAKKRHIPVQKSIWMNVNICWATALVSVIHRFATCVLIWP